MTELDPELTPEQKARQEFLARVEKLRAENPEWVAELDALRIKRLAERQALLARREEFLSAPYAEYPSLDEIARLEKEMLSNGPPRDYAPIPPLWSMPYDDYLKTPHWKAARQQALERAHHRCQVCNSDEQPLQVHHRTYERRGQELPQDLIVLCSICHDLFHKHGRLAGGSI